MRRDWYFECWRCGAKLEYGTANDDEKLRLSGWLLESDPQESPEGYSTIRFTCPKCAKGEMDEKRQDLESR